MNDYTIRLETAKDHREVENLVREAFWNVYRPGCIEHYLLHCLRKNKDFVHELNFVMEKENRIIGQNVFVHANIKADDNRDSPIMTMGPISVAPDFKGRGYGKILLDYTLEKAKALGAGAVCIEGNINFYGKSGFEYASKYNLRYHGAEVGENTSFFLCKELSLGYLNGISGVYQTPSAYLIDESKLSEFDKQFPYKEKLKLPSQLF